MRRLHDWLHRRRLIRGQQWGQPSLLHRVLRIRHESAIILALPPLLLCVWYSFTAWTAHLTHEAEVNVTEPFTVRLFQLHLHDKLTRDLNRLLAPEPQRKSPLPTYGLVIGNDELDQLASRLPPDDGQPYYVDAELVKGSRAFAVQVRYRGGKYWHYNHPQKSWKVRVKDGKVIEGLNTFNLINTPESVPFEEELILDVAREMGLLTPDYFPFRLLVNKVYTGVHFFEAQPDEGMLRHAMRPPGTIYSGSDSPVDEASGISSLFKSADNFTKVTQGIHQKLGERVELESLIAAINLSSPREFAHFSDSHLDVEKFAQWDALDVVFGCNQHDFSENHKLYFDPYRDRFEPIAWNFRGCKHDLEFNRTENPLILRLKQLPGYTSRRNRIVYELLHGAASQGSLRERARRLLDRLREDQVRDPYWDAFQLLPAVSPYYSSLLRPVDRRAQDIALETRLFEMGERERYLLGKLEEHDIGASLTAAVPTVSPKTSRTKAVEKTSVFDVTVTGHSGYSLMEVEPVWPKDCGSCAWRLYADTQIDGVLQPDQDRELGQRENKSKLDPQAVDLYPGAVMKSRPLHVHRGRVRMTPEPRAYRFFATSSDCAPTAINLRVRNLVTQTTMQIMAAAETGHEPLSIPATHCNDKYAEEPGHSAPHPWCFALPHKSTISMGPGVVEVDQGRTYPSEQAVEIMPGTTIRLAQGASLVFMGKVVARGTATLPIQFEAKNGTWGGLALQGEGANGSVFEHVRVSGGTRPYSTTPIWPGVVNISDTSDIRLEHCTISADTQASVGINIGESKNVLFAQSTVRGGLSVQVQYSSAVLDGLTVIGSAGDGISLVASQSTIRASKILACGGDGISANRQSQLSLVDTVVAIGSGGLRVHEASEVQYERVLLFGNRECVGYDASSDSYSRKAHMGGSGLFTVDCHDPVPKSARRAKALGQASEQLSPQDLVKVRTEVLGISEWSQLGANLTNQVKGDAS